MIVDRVSPEQLGGELNTEYLYHYTDNRITQADLSALYALNSVKFLADENPRNSVVCVGVWVVSIELLWVDPVNKQAQAAHRWASGAAAPL